MRPFDQQRYIAANRNGWPITHASIRSIDAGGLRNDWFDAAIDAALEAGNPHLAVLFLYGA